MVEQRLIDANGLETIDIKAPEDYQEWPPLELFAEGQKPLRRLLTSSQTSTPKACRSCRN